MDVLSLIKHSFTVDSVNSISKYYQLGKQTGSAGPEMVWKICEATALKERSRTVSVFIFDKKVADKIHRPKRRDAVSEVLRRDVRLMSRLKHSAILRLIHPLEECNDSLAFASETVLGSLANLLGCHEKVPSNVTEPKIRKFTDLEIKCGILQIADALSYLHNTERILHLNVSPSSVVVTARFIWKLAGFGFAEKALKDGSVKDHSSVVVSWNSRQYKMAQPDLDFVAPEIQLDQSGHATPSCDMYSLGMLICALYNNGHSLIQAAHSSTLYAKQFQRMSESFGALVEKMPVELVEPVEKMINRDVRYRPTAQLFTLLKYFDDPVAQCMKQIDNVELMDMNHKASYFKTLANTIQLIPQKMLYESVLPILVENLKETDTVYAALPALLALVAHSSKEEYKTYLQQHVNKLLAANRPIQATVYLLDNLDILLGKVSEDEVKRDIVPMIFSTLESNSIPGHEAAISVFSVIHQYMDNLTIRRLVLPKAKALFNKATNVKTKQNALVCVDRLLDSLDKMVILDEVLPFLTEISCSDVDIIMTVIGIYQHLLSDRKFGLTHNLLATKILPTLIPHSVSPGLTIEQFNIMMDVLRTMLSQIDRQRRLKMISEVPDNQALESRTNLQQLQSYCMNNNRSYVTGPTAQVGGPTGQMGSPYTGGRYQDEEYPLPLTSRQPVSKRSSLGSSNSSIGSSYSRHSSRRASVDTRFGLFDPSRLDSNLANRYLLSVDEAYYGRNNRRGSMYRFGCRQAPSTPELMTKGSSRESLDQPTYKRYSSFQGLGMITKVGVEFNSIQDEQAAIDKMVRRSSLAPRSMGGTTTPHIMVSEASLPSERRDTWSFLLGSTPRRSSTQSVGATGPRRDSRDQLSDSFRRQSFQGLCETAFFGMK